MYGPGGLLQYQLALPDGAEDALRASFGLVAERRLPVYLAVLKRFGAASEGPLSFPLRGVTLALDLPAQAPGVRPTLDELDEVVAGAGGRVYLSKDARMRPESLDAMYPRLAEFEAVRARVDPHAVLCSDLARRVGLAGARG
jgi:decaprenylphospho-beta-D-ribofuranose 2-oxidase